MAQQSTSQIVGLFQDIVKHYTELTVESWNSLVSLLGL